jgi:hypothetical protein
MRKYWKVSQYHSGRFTFHEEDKKFFREKIIELNIWIADNYLFGKVVKDIIYEMRGDALKLVPNVMKCINEGF